MGINALVKHGFTMTHSDGTWVEPNCKDVNVSTTSVKVINVLLDKTVHLKPHQSKVIQTVLEAEMMTTTGDFMISPNETVLAERNCDVPEKVVSGNVNKITTPLNNWGGSPIVMKKGSKIAVLEEVTRVDKSDDIWMEQSPEVVRMCQTNTAATCRCQELSGQLKIGNACNKKGKSKLKELLLQYHDINFLHCVIKSWVKQIFLPNLLIQARHHQ